MKSSQSQTGRTFFSTLSHQSERGFSLLEILISIAILIVGVYMANLALTRVDGQQHHITDKLKARHLLDRRVSDIITNSGFYPPMLKNGKPVTFIGCFNSEGFPTANKLGASDTYSEQLVDPSQISGGCPDSNFEIHITPNSNSQADLYIFVKEGDANGKVKQRLHMSIEQEPLL